MALKILRVFLNLFDGEAGAEGAGAAAEAAQGADDTSRVIYGKQAAEATQTSEPIAEESPAEAEEVNPEKEFKELVRTKYKAQYEAELQKAINRRFRNAKANEEELAKHRKLSAYVSRKYENIDASNLDELVDAVRNDDYFIEDIAYKNGRTPDQQRVLDSLQEDAAELKALKQQIADRQEAQEKSERWRAEFTALKEKYGEFDVQECLDDPNFMAAIESGTPVEFAFHGKFHDRLMSDALKFTATQTEKDIVDNIRAKGMRPSENGSSTSNAGFVQKADPSKLTASDFEEIAKRIRRGEKISF